MRTCRPVERRVTLGVAVALFLAVQTAAWGTVRTTPQEAVAGTDVEVRFLVSDGCDGSPTTALTVVIPPTVTNPTPRPTFGFEAAIQPSGTVVTWTGGLLPSDSAATFALVVSLPDTPGLTLHFPVIQACQTGELRYTQLLDPGATGTSGLAAPALRLVPASGSNVPQSLPRAAPVPPEPQGGVAAGAGGTAVDLRLTYLVVALLAGLCLRAVRSTSRR